MKGWAGWRVDVERQSSFRCVCVAECSPPAPARLRMGLRHSGGQPHCFAQRIGAPQLPTLQLCPASHPPPRFAPAYAAWGCSQPWATPPRSSVACAQSGRTRTRPPSARLTVGVATATPPASSAMLRSLSPGGRADHDGAVAGGGRASARCRPQLATGRFAGMCLAASLALPLHTHVAGFEV